MGRSWLASGIGIALMFSVACSGGSGGSGVVGGGPSGSTNLVMNFQAAQPSPGPLSVAMSEVSGPADDQVVVRVSVTDTTDVFGAGFDVLFDASQVRFVQWTAGTLIESAGPAIYAVTEGAPGNLVIGISCAGCSGGADANGTVRLIDLIFETTDSDSNGSALTFNSAALQDSQPPLPGPIAGLSWFGGDLVIN